MLNLCGFHGRHLWYIQYTNSNPLGEYELGLTWRGFELSGSIYMQISTRGNGNLVLVRGVFRVIQGLS